MNNGQNGKNVHQAYCGLHRNNSGRKKTKLILRQTRVAASLVVHCFILIVVVVVAIVVTRSGGIVDAEINPPYGGCPGLSKVFPLSNGVRQNSLSCFACCQGFYLPISTFPTYSAAFCPSSRSPTVEYVSQTVNHMLTCGSNTLCFVLI